MRHKSRVAAAILALTVVASLSACGDTWRGVKQDTGENLNKTGEAIDHAGDKVRPN